MSEKLEQLCRRLAGSESRDKLRRLMREAQRLGAEDLAARAAAKIAKLPGKPLGGSCPQIRQIIEPWTYDEHGNMSRVSYSVDA
jgi:hypothetical protein